jgi:hypothetical protein
MKRCFFAVLLSAVLGFSTCAHAYLQDNGGGLIYDTDLNITWYDYTKSKANWYDQVAWAGGLSAGGVTGWRLPSTVDGPWVMGYNGNTTAGYSITTSEMGHLFYTELGNKGYCDLNGVGNQSDWGLVNKGPFTNLIFFLDWPSAKDAYYWSSTKFSGNAEQAWVFNLSTGEQEPRCVY